MNPFLLLMSTFSYVSSAYIITGLLMVIFVIHMLRQRRRARRLGLSGLEDTSALTASPLDPLITKCHDAAKKTSS